MSRDDRLDNTTCSRGHVHPPWNTTGVLRIAKCESVCGFCQKETKTAANLRKHVAIHIKNERLNLTIAEGSSGRGRLEMSSRNNSSSRVSPPHRSDEDSPSPGRAYNRVLNQAPKEPFSPSAVLMSMASQPHSQPTSTSSTPRYTFPSSNSGASSSTYLAPHSLPSPIPHYPSTPPDHFRPLRHHNLPTKTAWTPIPSSEGFRILDYCKALSTSGSEDRVPCYNRETIFDEEWQAHMKDVHGVYLLWPETWMRRIEVLDLDAFGGDIAACNDVVMGT